MNIKNYYLIFILLVVLMIISLGCSTTPFPKSEQDNDNNDKIILIATDDDNNKLPYDYSYFKEMNRMYFYKSSVIRKDPPKSLKNEKQIVIDF